MAEAGFFDKSDGTLRFLMRSFSTVLKEAGAADVEARLPWRAWWSDEGAGPHSEEGFPPELAERCVQAYSLALQLLNASEENATAQERRQVEDEGRLLEESGSWDQILALGLSAGLDGATIARALRNVRVEPVLTAHPTEAKRQTVLEHHRVLYRLLVELENTMWTTAEREDLERQVRAAVERLWRTGEIYLQKPVVADERRMVLHYLTKVFPNVVSSVERRLCSAWGRAGLDPALLDGPERMPRLQFGDWVGGDRDGHPLVTPEVTRETLELFRQSALELLDARLEELASRLSLSELRQPIPARLTRRIQQLVENLGEEGQRAVDRNREEPWRQLVNLMRIALPFPDRPSRGRYRDAVGLLSDLRELQVSLQEVGASRLARTDVHPVISLVRTFGFHLATVDIRQNSAFHDRALAQLFVLGGDSNAHDYPNWDSATRRPLLERELATRRPFVLPDEIEGAEAKAVIELYRRLNTHRRTFGAAGIGALIVSMTRSIEDLLAVYVLARDGGLLVHDDGDAYCPLPVVPLFETINDLERAPEILDEYLEHPIVRASLGFQQRVGGHESPVQQVMVGYSDSGKDGGIGASVWNLYESQSAMAEVGRRRGVRIRFFHGRGGTIGRGAGPTHRFLRALPPKTVQGDLRLTEQGETIRQKYANHITAAHHLELLLAGTLGVTLLDEVGRPDSPELVDIVKELAAASHRAYRELRSLDGFSTFFAEATPIDAIEASRIGSRPARRTGQRTLDDLRAIPWVFAWNQSRFGLPGWFGLGSALMGVRDRDESRFQALIEAKRVETRWAPIHYLISNAATAFAMASPEMMRRYAGLVKDRSLAERVLGHILEEHGRMNDALVAIYGAPLREARPSIQGIIDRRNAALEPLHLHQIALLKRWRNGDNAREADLVTQLLLTVNAIASGLGTTG